MRTVLSLRRAVSRGTPKFSSGLEPESVDLEQLRHAFRVEFQPHLDHVKYTYQRLSKESCFRILTLHAGTGDEPLRASLQEDDLESHPNYECLSYAWESNTKPFLLFLDEGFITITKSLKLALLHVRQ